MPDNPENTLSEEEAAEAVVHAFDSTVQDKPSSEGAEPTLEEQLSSEKDRALRLQAELQNVLSRSSREVANERKYGSIGLMRDLLPVLDNIDRALEAMGALEAAEKEAEGGGLTEGFRLVRQQLLTLLQQHDCKAMETQGAEFDPEQHEAILQQPSSDHPAGTVVLTTQTGYKLHDRVVRPAQVIVSSGAPAEME